MAAQIIAKQTDVGWDVTIRDADVVVVRTEGKRLVVAASPDDDDTPVPTPTPLSVSLG